MQQQLDILIARAYPKNHGVDLCRVGDFMLSVKIRVLFLAFCVALGGLPAHSVAQSSGTTREFNSADRERINSNTVTVLSGNPNGTYLAIAYDMAAVLDNGDNFRLIPMVGKGGYHNVRDLLHLKGVDVAITQSNIMSYLRKTNEFGPAIERRLSLITKLYNEEVHIVAGSGINSLSDLEGKVVNYSDAGSGTQFSSRLIFAALGIKPKEVNMGQSDAFAKIRTGEVAASVLIAGKPAGSWSKLKLEPGMKVLAVPFAEQLETDYFPAKLTHEDYPDAIPQGTSVDTIAVGAVLATINWANGSDRYKRVARLTETLFEKFEEFKKAPRHSKWREVNLATELPGWVRFGAAKQWLDQQRAASITSAAVSSNGSSTAATAGTRRTFEQFLATQRGGQSGAAGAAAVRGGRPQTEQELFQKFLEWMKTQPNSGNAGVGSGSSPTQATGASGGPQPQRPSTASGTRLW